MTVTVEEVERQLEEKEYQIRALEDDLEEAFNENEKKEERIRQLELQVKKSKNDLSDTKEMYMKMRTDCSKLYDYIGKLSTDILGNYDGKTNVSTIVESIIESFTKLKEERRESENKEKRVEEPKEEKEEMLQLRNRIHETQQQLSERGAEIMNLKREVKELNQEREKLQEALMEKAEEVEAMQAVMQEDDEGREEEEKALRMEIDGLKNELSGLKEESSRLKEESSRLKEESSRLKEELNEKSSAMELMSATMSENDAEIDGLKNELSGLKEESSRLKEELNEKSSAMELMSATMSENDAEIDGLKNELSGLKEESSRLKEESSRLKEELNEKSSAMELMSATMSENDAEIDHLNSTISSLSSSLSDCQSSLSSDYYCFSSLSLSVRHSYIYSASLSAVFNDVFCCFLAFIDSISYYRCQVQSMTMRIQQLESEIPLYSPVRSLNANDDRLHGAYSDLVSALSRRVQSLESQLVNTDSSSCFMKLKELQSDLLSVRRSLSSSSCCADSQPSVDIEKSDFHLSTSPCISVLYKSLSDDSHISAVRDKLSSLCKESYQLEDSLQSDISPRRIVKELIDCAGGMEVPNPVLDAKALSSVAICFPYHCRILSKPIAPVLF